MKIKKETDGGLFKALESTDEELALVNEWTRAPLKAEDVYLFRACACDDQVDRDLERFTLNTLNGLADLLVGKPVLTNHAWDADASKARIYAAEVQHTDSGNRLMLRCYIPRKGHEQFISDVDGGLYRELSVGCAVKHTVCSICGEDLYSASCQHQKGNEYAGVQCIGLLDGAADAYEVSFVAVPAQLGAGVIKGASVREEMPEEVRCLLKQGERLLESVAVFAALYHN